MGAINVQGPGTRDTENEGPNEGVASRLVPRAGQPWPPTRAAGGRAAQSGFHHALEALIAERALLAGIRAEIRNRDGEVKSPRACKERVGLIDPQNGCCR